MFLFGSAWAVILLGLAFLAYELPGIYWFTNKLFKKILRRTPVNWNFDGFLGSSWHQGEPVYVSVFQINGECLGSGFTSIRNAQIVSLQTCRSIPVSLKTDQGYVSAEETNPIPKGAKIYAHGLFYNSDIRQSNEREGISEDIFLNEWGQFEFQIEYDRKKFSKKFSKKEIEKEILRVKPHSNENPRVTKK